MKDNSLIINPYFEKFLIKARQSAVTLFRLFSYFICMGIILLLLYFGVSSSGSRALVTAGALALIWLGIAIVFKLWLKSVFLREITARSTAFLSAVLIMLVVFYPGFFSERGMGVPPSEVSGNITPTFADPEKLHIYLAELVIIIIVAAFFTSFYALVTDVLTTTVEDLSAYAGWGNLNKTKYVPRIFFALLFFLSTSFVFYFFGDCLWYISEGLLVDVSAAFMLVDTLLAVYYIKLALQS